MGKAREAQMDRRDFIRKVMTFIVLGTLGLLMAWVPGAALGGELPRQGGTLVFCPDNEPDTLVAVHTAADPTILLSTKIHEGLLKMDEEGNFRGSLAETWTVAPDGKSITFNLRKGVKWHDGQEFTSADAAFSIMSLKALHPRGSATFGLVEGVDTPDKYTAVLKLSGPAPYLLMALCGFESPMVPKHVYGDADFRSHPNNNAPIGTGPFKFSEWKKGSHITLERFADYWDKPKPYLDKIIFKFIPDAASRAVAFETKEVDIGGMNPVPMLEVKRLAQLPFLGIETKGYTAVASVHRIEFNLSNEYFKHLKVRQAIAHAVDKDFIQKNIWFGFGLVIDSPIHPYVAAFYTNDVPHYPFDPKKAEALLDEAGFPRGKDGVRFKVTHDPLPIGENFNKTAEYLKAALKKVGIEVTIRTQDMPAYLKRVYTDRDFDFINNGMNAGPDPTLGVQRLYWSKNFIKGVPFSNGSGYSNPEMDRLLEDAAREIDNAKRVELWHQMQKLASQDLPAIPILGQERVTIYNKKVKNHTISPAGIYDTYADAYMTE
jgi:peptide/nickel transport system substrate-binding protein